MLADSTGVRLWNRASAAARELYARLNVQAQDVSFVAHGAW